MPLEPMTPRSFTLRDPQTAPLCPVSSDTARAPPLAPSCVLDPTGRLCLYAAPEPQPSSLQRGPLAPQSVAYFGPRALLLGDRGGVGNLTRK